MANEDSPAAAPGLADQVSRLYDLIAGYHATQLIEIARELGVWEALTERPGTTSEGLAAKLGTEPLLHRRALPDGVLLRAARACR